MTTDEIKTPNVRCAECNCDHGGVYCNWIASRPAEYRTEIARLTSALECVQIEKRACKDEIARLTAERDTAIQQRDFHQQEYVALEILFDKAVKDLDTARAEMAMTFEVAAGKAGERSAQMPHDDDMTRGYACGRSDAACEIRALSPADAKDALAARDRAMREAGRAEGLREAAALANRYASEDVLHPAHAWLREYTYAWEQGGVDHCLAVRGAILALINRPQAGEGE